MAAAPSKHVSWALSPSAIESPEWPPDRGQIDVQISYYPERDPYGLKETHFENWTAASVALRKIQENDGLVMSCKVTLVAARCEYEPTFLGWADFYCTQTIHKIVDLWNTYIEEEQVGPFYPFAEAQAKFGGLIAQGIPGSITFKNGQYTISQRTPIQRT